MERKVPPPRGFGGPPVVNGAQPQPFALRNGLPNAFAPPPVAVNNEQNAPPPPQSFGFQTARGPVNTNAGAARRGWRPGRVGGRHDSPLYGNHRKRLSSSSIDSNVSWSGSEIESVGGFGATHSEQEQVSRLSWASSVAVKEEASSAAQQDLAPASSLFGSSAVEQQQPPVVSKVKQFAGSEAAMGVQPPKTPLGKPTQDDKGGISAAQRVRMELSTHAESRAGSRANSSENVFANPIPPVYDEEKHGPQSCPSTFNSTKQPQFSIDKLRQLRSNELVASKLLPTRTSVNSLMGYVRELQLSEATLRKQLVTTKQHTEEELSQSLSKVNELERTMQEVEKDRELARRKLEEQEQLIRDLAAKLKQAEAAKAKSSAPSAVDELPPIAEEAISHTATEAKTTTVEESEPGTPAISHSTPAPPVQPPLPPMKQQLQAPMPPAHPHQPTANNRAAQFGPASPRSPNRPLWDPWASGGATSMKNLPPVFTIGSTGLDSVVASSTSAAQASRTDATTTAPGEYELKSVLLSPRRVQDQVEASENDHRTQQVLQNEYVAADQEFAPQYPAPVFNVGAMPSPPYPQQQDFSSSETQNVSYGEQAQEEAPLMVSPSQAVPMLPAETMSPADGNAYVQQEASSAFAEGTTDASGGEWNEFQSQQEVQPPAPPVAAAMENTEAVAPPPPSFAEPPTVPPPSQAMTENGVSEVATPYSESAQVDQPQQATSAEAQSFGASTPSAPPTSSTPTPPPPTSEVQPPHLASPAQAESKVVAAEQVSLETLLVDFFTEVDKKRLKMAKTYGKRYAGREKWLFAELTKRYGAAKVAALKARYENGSGGDVSTTSSSGGNVKKEDHATDTSDHPKAGRQGHPRHPHFFHPPTPASNVDLSAGMPPAPSPVAVPQENDTSSSEPGQEAEDTRAPPSPSGKVSPRVRASPPQRGSGGNVPPFAPPPSFPTPQETGERNSAATVDTDGPPMMNGPPPPAQRGVPGGQFKPPPPPFQPGMENINAAPLGLRQRHHASGPSTRRQDNAGAEPPAVTLEGLLKELYKAHQPDKLKNAPIVAKQYAGKERELVGLLKGKYGALSVKRLEENLEVLERAHRARMAGKGAGKKRGCFVRTISLVFWLSVLLYFSFGAVFVSFVVLDEWECHALDNDEQELESAEECLPLKKELETFTYERVADYMSQSHPAACFCSEWKARESALFTNLSGDDLVNLVRLVPFSPESFGTPWILSVKEQVPSQEFYDSYAKPVVDLSLDVGSFVWSSVLELAGYDEASEEKEQIVEDVVENGTADVSSFGEENENDVYKDSLEQVAKEVDNESFVNDEVEGDGNAEDQLTEDVEAETEVDEVPDALEQVPVEEESFTFEDVLENAEPDAAAKDDVSVEDASPVEEESASVEEENFLFAAEVEGEEHATVESIDVVESEDAQATKKPESVDASEEESADAVETEVTETPTEDDSLLAAADKTNSIEDDDVEVSATFGDEVVDATVDAVEEIPEAAVEESEEVSVEETADASGDIVEVEVRQEGLDLSYPETEADATEEELAAESTEMSASALKEFEPVDDDGDIPSASGEAEPGVTLESEDVSVEALEESEPVVDAVEEDLAMPITIDAEVELTDSEFDVDAASEAIDVEIENVEEEPVSSKDVEVEGFSELSEESMSVTEPAASGALIPTDVGEVPVVELEDAKSAASEESEVEAGKDDVDAPIEVQATEETLSNDEEVVTFEEDYANVMVEEESVVTDDETELSTGSSDIDTEEPLSEESMVSFSNEDVEVIDGEGNGDEDVALVEETESLSEDAGATLDEENVRLVGSDDEDESTILAEVETVTPEFEVEEDVAGVVDEAAEQQLTENPDHEAFEPMEDLEDVTAAPAEIEPATEKEGEMEGKPSTPAETELKSLEGAEDEKAEVGNDEAESATRSDIEAEQFVSGVDLVSEVDEEFVAIEATEASVDADAAEPTEHVSEHEQVEDADNVADSITLEEIPAADEPETAAVAEDEAPDADDEAIAVSADEEAPVADVETPVADLEEAPVVDEAIESANGIESAEEALNADEPAATDNESELEQVADESSTSASEEEESGGLVSAVNEVLARLVEPFEAAKTAAPGVEGGHEVDEL